MAEGMHYLSDSDVKILKEWIYQGKGQVRRVRPEEEQRTSQAPEVYIALPPLAGIPALLSENGSTGTGTGTDVSQAPSELDKPGYADCQIAKIVDNGLGVPNFELTGKTERVYNLTDSLITQGWIQVNRDKFGKWLVVKQTNAQTLLGTPTELTFEFHTTTFDVDGASVTAYVRKGFVYPNLTYTLAKLAGSPYAYDVIDPELEFVGVAGADIPNGGATAIAVVILNPADFTPAGSDPYNNFATSVQSYYGDVSAGSRIRCRYLTASRWEVVNAECVTPGTGSGT